MATEAQLHLSSGLKTEAEVAHHAALHGAGPMQQRFYPYDYNGGTVLAVAGPDYAIVAGDTRMSTGYSIKCRNVSKIYEMCAEPPPRLARA